MVGLAQQILVTCEHACNRLPDGFALDGDVQQLHVAWDPGALVIAEHLARRFEAPLWRGEYSRLVADLNRSVGNRMLIRPVSDGHPIHFNYGLSQRARAERVARYHRPYREGVERAAQEIIARHGRCVQISVHTFTPTLDGKLRRNDIGLLHDPRWGIERQVCRDLRAHLDSQTEYVTWFNRPYSGTADGILPAMRRQHGEDTFLGIELEINQKYADRVATLRSISEHIGRAFDASTALAVGCG